MFWRTADADSFAKAKAMDQIVPPESVGDGNRIIPEFDEQVAFVRVDIQHLYEYFLEHLETLWVNERNRLHGTGHAHLLSEWAGERASGSSEVD